jgi:hypothetical protein
MKKGSSYSAQELQMLTDEIIDDYILGKLGPAQAQELERAVAADPAQRARLDEARLMLKMLRSSAPEVPSERMWSRIRPQLGLPQARRPFSLASRLLDLVAAPRMRYGLGGAAALIFLALGIQVARRPQPSPPQAAAGMAEIPKAPAPQPSKKLAASRPEPKKAAAQAKMAALAPAQKPEKHELTEVEKALAEQDLDDVVATLLRQPQAPRASFAQARQSGMGAENVAYGSPAEPGMNGGASPVAYVTSSIESAQQDQESGPQPQAQGRVGVGGFWDFHPAALALNRRDWPAASSELQAAAGGAPEAAERSFAQSTLQLLSQAGEPVQGGDPSQAKGLSVESSARWQVFVDNHQARYFGGVVARMPGLRSSGQALTLDMAFDRASFSPGTRFERLADDAAATVKNAQGEVVNSTEFSAVQGAEYLMKANELRLK